MITNEPKEYRVHNCYGDTKVVLHADSPKEGQAIDSMTDAGRILTFLRNEIPAQTYKALLEMIWNTERLIKLNPKGEFEPTK